MSENPIREEKIILTSHVSARRFLTKEMQVYDLTVLSIGDDSTGSNIKLNKLLYALDTHERGDVLRFFDDFNVPPFMTLKFGPEGFHGTLTECTIDSRLIRFLTLKAGNITLHINTVKPRGY